MNKERLAGDRFQEIKGFIAYFLACVGETQTQISPNLSPQSRTLGISDDPSLPCDLSPSQNRGRCADQLIATFAPGEEGCVAQTGEPTKFELMVQLMVPKPNEENGASLMTN